MNTEQEEDDDIPKMPLAHGGPPLSSLEKRREKTIVLAF